MNTIENNKLIAEFMGFDMIEGNKIISVIKDNQLKVFNPNNSWNWLMELVNKCLEICHENMLNEWETGFSDSFFSRDINCMYAEGVRFIKWYNQQNPKP
jgi:hypothetical protein